MSAHKLVLTVLIVAAAVTLGASPTAFATPALTRSTGAIPVAPFFTPVGNTLGSSITAPSTSRWTFAAGGVSFTCATVWSGYVPTTHTNLRVTRLDLTRCTTSLGAMWTPFATASASSVAPWTIHVRSIDVTGSYAGTIEIPAGGSLTIDVTGLSSCRITIGPQSIDLTGVNATRQLAVNDASVAFTRIGANDCPASGNGTMAATYIMKSDTAADEAARALRVTAAS
jgi:hypothetical protein